MMKKNKLYTVNKYNRPMFMPKENLFAYGTPTLNGIGQMNVTGGLGNVKAMANNPTTLTNAKLNAMNQPSVSRRGLLGGLGSGIGSALIGGAAGLGAQIIGDTIGGVAGAIGSGANSLLGGKKKSGVGNAVQSVTGGLGDIVGGVPIIGGLAKGALNLVGGITGGIVNGLFGQSVDEEALKEANSGTDAYNNFLSNAGSFDDIRGPQAQAGVRNVYADGLFGGDADEKNEALRQARADAKSWAFRSVDNNIRNLADDQVNNALANFAAFGGPIDTTDMGAINYDFMDRYLTTKERKKQYSNPPTNLFAIGGDLQTHGADWSTGLVSVNAGGSHEESPYDGVQLGQDENLVPNLVEEGETVYDDYVFSNRILADEATKKLFHLPKKKDITFADISKKLEKEIAERPNDPISEAGFKAQMQTLEEQQERQKQEMEAERAKAAFEALSPEEQTAIMQRAAQEKAMAQQAAEEQAMQEMAGGAQLSPEEAMMMQQQVDGTQAAVGQPVPEMAEGGKLFKKGGRKNSGKWKDEHENHWDVYTKKGLKKYIQEAKKRLDAAPEDKKSEVRQQIADEFNALQQSYYDNVLPQGASGNYSYDEGVRGHQQMFDKMFGNTGFYSTDDKGNITNLIADAIDMPKGHNTTDTPINWADGYAGPRTSIRNFGSTEYGDDAYYKDLVNEFKDNLGLVYAPNDNWGYGNEGQHALYGVSVAPVAADSRETAIDEEIQPEAEAAWNYGDPNYEEQPSETKAKDNTTSEEIEPEIEPVMKDDRLRYAGLLGPAVGLGMMAAGVGRPDYSGLDAAVSNAGRTHLATYKPLGNYLTYRPMDIWFEQNRMDANARAIDRAIVNNAAPIGTKMAGLLASGYNSQIADGELYRKALEYNDAKRNQVADFNRGTDQFNAEAFNRLSQFNASALNEAASRNINARLHAAQEKLNRDAGWYNSLYGNVSGLFKGLSDLGRENRETNWRNALVTSGAMGVMDNDQLVKARIAKYKTDNKSASGGKVKKGKRGLTY